MRIVINTAHQRFGGAIQVAYSFIHECKKFTEYEYIVWLGQGLEPLIDTSSFPDNFKFRTFNFGKISFGETFRINKKLKEFEEIDNPDVIISTSGPTYFNSSVPQIIGFNLPLYIYPESPFLHGLSLYRKLRLFLKKKLHYYFFNRDASVFVVQTDDVNNRVKKDFPNKEVYTVTNTYNNFYREKRIFENKLPAKDPETFRFLTISSFYGHKNLEIIPLIIDELKNQGINNVEFILTLKEEDAGRLGVQDYNQILNVGPVKPVECPSLYNECDALFLPTLAECFSASYPESMIMKKPIVTTDLGFARSICGEAALYFKPKNASHASKKIVELIEDKSLQSVLVEKGLVELNKFDSAEDRAKKYLSICKSMLNKKHN